MKKSINVLTLAASVSVFATLASAATTLPTAPYLPLDMAQKAANAAMKKCIADGQRVSVAVVERSGATKGASESGWLRSAHGFQQHG